MDQRSQAENIVTAYVTFVGARVHRDAVSAKTLTVGCDFEYIGVVFASGVT